MTKHLMYHLGCQDRIHRQLSPCMRQKKLIAALKQNPHWHQSYKWKCSSVSGTSLCHFSSTNWFSRWLYGHACTATLLRPDIGDYVNELNGGTKCPYDGVLSGRCLKNLFSFLLFSCFCLEAACARACVFIRVHLWKSSCEYA